jgi:hypothetical protein
MKTQMEDGILGFQPYIFSTTRTTELSVLRAGRTVPTGLLSEDKKKIGHLKISKDLTGNRTWNLQSCDAMTQSTAPPLDPFQMIKLK